MNSILPHITDRLQFTFLVVSPEISFTRRRRQGSEHEDRFQQGRYGKWFFSLLEWSPSHQPSKRLCFNEEFTDTFSIDAYMVLAEPTLHLQEQLSPSVWHSSSFFSRG